MAVTKDEVQELISQRLDNYVRNESLSLAMSELQRDIATPLSDLNTKIVEIRAQSEARNAKLDGIVDKLNAQPEKPRWFETEFAKFIIMALVVSVVIWVSNGTTSVKEVGDIVSPMSGVSQ